MKRLQLFAKAKLIFCMTVCGSTNQSLLVSKSRTLDTAWYGGAQACTELRQDVG